MDYVLHICIIACIYGVLATSLNLVAGYTGMLSVAQAAFYGIGAYASALVSVNLEAPFLWGVLISAIIAGVLSLTVSLPAARLQHDYFAIATFGFQFIVWNLFNNWIPLTRGPMGITGIPRPRILGFTLETPMSFLILSGGMLLLAYMVSARIVQSPFGRLLTAIRDDETLVQMLGKSPALFKIKIFALSATMAGVAGAVYAHYFTYVSPGSFTVMESVLILSMVIIGGSGSMRGPILGAVALVTLPEILRFFGMPSNVAGTLRQVIYGSALVATALYRPQGLLGQYGFGR
jgi:branched-chain amino acid transport system permease protein